MITHRYTSVNIPLRSFKIVRTYSSISIVYFLSQMNFWKYFTFSKTEREGKEQCVISIKTGREAISEGKHRCEESQRPNVGMGP